MWAIFHKMGVATVNFGRHLGSWEYTGYRLLTCLPINKIEVHLRYWSPSWISKWHLIMTFDLYPSSSFHKYPYCWVYDESVFTHRKPPSWILGRLVCVGHPFFGPALVGPKTIFQKPKFSSLDFGRQFWSSKFYRISILDFHLSKPFRDIQMVGSNRKRQRKWLSWMAPDIDCWLSTLKFVPLIPEALGLVAIFHKAEIAILDFGHHLAILLPVY